MSRNILHRTNFGKRMGKAITPVVFLLGMATTSHATGLEGEPAGSNSRNGAEFTFTINQETCAVTINSNKRIRRFAFKNEAGRTIKAHGVGREMHLTGFVAELTAHPRGQISIRSGDRIWTRLDANVNLAFAECIAPQPTVFAQAYSDLDGNGSYDPAYDELIARLTDNNGDGLPGPGDLLELGSSPTSFSGPEERYTHNYIGSVSNVYTDRDSGVLTYVGVDFGGSQPNGESAFSYSTLYFFQSPTSRKVFSIFINDTAGEQTGIWLIDDPQFTEFPTIRITSTEVGGVILFEDSANQGASIEDAFRIEIFDPAN